MKTFLSVFFITAAITLEVNAQTNVSGGIYTDTTWTLAGSPYIVVDTVVLFPGVTLTIDPGVTVQFENNKRLENRNGILNAIGTITDSITFTSNAATPTIGIWSSIYLSQMATTNLKYCNISYANYAVYSEINVLNTHISNSTLMNNNSAVYAPFANGSFFTIDSCNLVHNINYGAHGYSMFLRYSNVSYNNLGAHTMINSDIKNCIIDSNTECGIHSNAYQIKIDSNVIKFNGIGIIDTFSSPYAGRIMKNVVEDNNVGLQLYTWNDSIYCNEFCNNTSYDLYYGAISGNNVHVANNYWCTTDSNTISARIYDGYDNINYSLVNFTPVDSLQCYLLAGMDNYVNKDVLYIFPNPASDNLFLTLDNNSLSTQINIYNVVGVKKLSLIITSQHSTIDISSLLPGAYFVEMISKDKIGRKKFIKQ